MRAKLLHFPRRMFKPALVFSLALLHLIPSAAGLAWINEFHYDNNGGDVNEFVEIAYTSDTDVSGWTLYFYNGSDGQFYASRSLSPSSAIVTGSGVSLLVVEQSGIQNGSKDGFALVDSNSNIVEFISYEGRLRARNGPAAGLRSRDVGVKESSSTSPTASLQLTGSGCSSSEFSWQSTAFNTKSQVNSGQSFPCLSGPPPPTSAPTNDPTRAPSKNPTPFPTKAPTPAPTSAPTSVPIPAPLTPAPINVSPAMDEAWINEIHYDNSGTDAGEFIEVAATDSTSLVGWSVILYNGSNGAQYSSTPLTKATSDGSGVSLLVVNYATNGIQNGNPDGVALVNTANQVVEFISYEGTMTATDGPASGMSSVSIGVSETSSTPAGFSLQRSGSGCSASAFPTWQNPVNDTPGAVNAGQVFACSPMTPVPLLTVAPVPSPIVAPVSGPSGGTVLDVNMLTQLSGQGSFFTSVATNEFVQLGYIPAGLSDVYVRIETSLDVDLQLFDGTARITHRSSEATASEDVYMGVQIQYSGYTGEQRSDALGDEYFFIFGTLPSDWTVAVSGFQSSGSASVSVSYWWGYYGDARSLTGASLKSTLHNIIDGHNEISYSECWAALRRTDQDPNDTNNVIGIYSRKSIPKVDQDSGCSCNDFWNREHVWPQSIGNFDTSLGPGTDIHSLRAEDKSLNTERSNKDFDEGGSSLNNSPQDCPSCLETSNTFEPPDEVKGSVARMIFYMATRWNGDSDSNSISLTVIDGFGSSSGSGTIGDLATLKTWNNLYPPSAEEYNRNNLIMDIQGNRNPFIDNPAWVDLIF